jgi:hypothetical protein
MAMSGLHILGDFISTLSQADPFTNIDAQAFARPPAGRFYVLSRFRVGSWLLESRTAMSNANPNQHNNQTGKQNEQPKRGTGAPPAHIDHINKVPQYQQATGEEKPEKEEKKK